MGRRPLRLFGNALNDGGIGIGWLIAIPGSDCNNGGGAMARIGNCSDILRRVDTGAGGGMDPSGCELVGDRTNSDTNGD